MLLEEYDEQACIRTWQEDGFIKGHEAGLQEKAVEAAIMLIHDFNVTPEVAAQKMGAPLEIVLASLKKIEQSLRNNFVLNFINENTILCFIHLMVFFYTMTVKKTTLPLRGALLLISIRN